MENKGGEAKNIELLNLGQNTTIEEINSLARDEFTRFTVSTIGSAQTYEARFSSLGSERFRQCWEIEGEKCKEITHGPELLRFK